MVKETGHKIRLGFTKLEKAGPVLQVGMFSLVQISFFNLKKITKISIKSRQIKKKCGEKYHENKESCPVEK
jgi:hypothetical protein